MANAFDLVRYPNIPYARTHPAALGVFAALFGRPFAPFSACRVLEIGCSEGVNLLNKPGKTRRFKNVAGKRNGYKKAYVRLEAGQSIDFTGAAK